VNRAFVDPTAGDVPAKFFEQADTPDELRDLVAEHCETGEIDRALHRLIGFTEPKVGDPTALAAAFGSVALDEACLMVGNVAAPTPPARYDHDLTVYVATELPVPGGHTFVIRDLIRARPDGRHVVLLSAGLGRTTEPDTEDLFGPGVDVEVAPHRRTADILEWLLDRLAALAPGRAFWVQHPQDAVATAACQPGLAAEMLFIHHNDHRLTLGLHVPHTRHVDFRPAGLANCAHVLGIPDTLLIPLTAGAPLPPSDVSDGPLTTASSGSWAKYGSPYPHRYQDLVPDIIETTGGRHVHVGYVPPWQVAGISAQLSYTGIPQNRFVNIRSTRSLRDTLRDEGVDVYIDSFPLGGCRSVVEAMSVGIPVIAHHHPVSELLSNETLAPAGSFTWSEPEELLEYLAETTPAAAAAGRPAVIEEYERFHRPELIAETLAGERVTGAVAEHRPYQLSTLDIHLAGSRQPRQTAVSGGPGVDTRIGRMLVHAMKWVDPEEEVGRNEISEALFRAAVGDAARKETRRYRAERNFLDTVTEGAEVHDEEGDIDLNRTSVYLFEKHVAADREPEEDPGLLKVPEERYRELRRAEQDLRWLLRRLGSGPAGVLTRRFGGFRKLLKRHLG
jgi:hypothetical protein